MNDSEKILTNSIVLPLKAIFSDFLNRYPEEYEKGNTLKNPFMKELKSRTYKAFENIPKDYNVSVRPIAGAGALRKDEQYIAVLAPGHKVSSGFYPIFWFDFVTKQIKLYLGCSNDNAMPVELIDKLKAIADKNLLDFREQSKQGFPCRVYDLDQSTDEQLSADLFRVLDVYKQCLEECKDEFQSFFVSRREGEEYSSDQDEEDFYAQMWVIKARELEDLTDKSIKESWIELESNQHIAPCSIVFLRTDIWTIIAVGVVTSNQLSDQDAKGPNKYRQLVRWVAKGKWLIQKDQSRLGTNDVQNIWLNFDRINQLKLLTDWNSYSSEIFRIQAGVRKRLKASEDMSNQKESIFSKNRIYFGPPGTGKTWAIQNDEIPRFVSQEQALTHDERLRDLVKDEPWWCVIAAALLDLGKSKVPTIAEHELVKARHAISGTKLLKNQIWAALQGHTFLDCPNVSYTSRQEPFLFFKKEDSTWEIRVDAVDNSAPEVRELLRKSKESSSDGKKIERFEVITFHQAFSYEDFIEGIKPVSDSETEGQLRYEIQSGVFKRLCERARADSNNEYAIFIDEINRGNVANIFGELISLIEEDKREGTHGELKITLPYSKDKFAVPANVSIIGTMNTADRSVEALDTALRRRFTFIEIKPDADILKSEGVSVPGVDIIKIFETINARIEKLLDKDHMLGHAYFIDLRGDRATLENLQEIFANKILPLLQEYFFGDLGRIGLVLGKRFVEQVGRQVAFADFDHGDREAVEERAVYRLIDPKTLSAQDFVTIYKEAN